MNESEKWQLIVKGEYENEDYVYDVEDRGTFTRVVDDAKAVFEKGHFVGFLKTFSDVSSYGMSCSIEDKAGLFLTDGRTFGKKEYYYSHCSTEKSRTSWGKYSIQKKEV